MVFIGIQSGHENTATNVDPTLRTETGAPGEEAFNVKVRDTLSQILIAYGFQVQLDDANANSSVNTIGKDFSFYLAIHAEGAPAGGNVVAPDPSVDASNTESIRIVNAIKSVYFADTGIVNDGLVTDNETFYYMWNILSAKTPCGIIECGDLADPHDSVILSDIRRVALGIAHGLCDAFGIAWKGDPAIPPNPPVTSPSPVTPPVTQPTTPSVITPVATTPPSPQPPAEIDYKSYLGQVWGVLNGKKRGFFWFTQLQNEIGDIQTVLKNAGITSV